jgi:hypothetical protein
VPIWTKLGQSHLRVLCFQYCIWWSHQPNICCKKNLKTPEVIRTRKIEGQIRERPFNLKGGLWFFSKKNILIPNVAEKNILILVWGKKKIIWFRDFVIKPNVKVLKKKFALHATNFLFYSNSCVVRKKNRA